MFRIAICDDDILFCSQLESMILAYYIFTDIEIDVFEDGKTLFLRCQQGEHYDLIFLDIEMIGLNGVSTGLKIRNELENEITQIVYISWKEDYYKQLFEVRPNNFLQKPIDNKSIIKEIEKARRLSQKLNNVFWYKKAYSSYKVFVKDILYFESSDKRVHIVTVHGDDYFYDRLDNVVKKLENLTFYQIHKSYFVNLTYVAKFQYKDLEMLNGDVLPISQSKRRDVRVRHLTMFEGEYK